MNWITSVVRPRVRSLLHKRETEKNLWIKCPTGELVFYKDLEANGFVSPVSDYHMRIPARKRLLLFFDEGKFEDVPVPKAPDDPLHFRDAKKYADRLRAAREATGLDDCVMVAVGRLGGLEVVVCAHEFEFIAGTLGVAAGNAVVQAADEAIRRRAPLILFAASGGARLQEGIFALMQMPRTTVAVENVKEARLPYIVVFTNPTMGGVAASYAMLGDIHLAEPGALIGFAGTRVIESTIREKVPENFRNAEQQRLYGYVDMVVHRHHIRSTVSRLCRLLTNAPPGEDLVSADAGGPEVLGVKQAADSPGEPSDFQGAG